MQRCGPSGMFLLSACFGVFDFGMFKYFLLFGTRKEETRPAACFGMFDFGMFKYFLLSACYVLRHV